ncbi:hypothetical protein R5R35_001592 [Gryllus longicercus]|uniref:AB hydrolase-1 domain-containing protein n=1 Tax=Gryllus longicercus TaxID=2509291 RepID=A0AAN9W1F7_9ORTH
MGLIRAIVGKTIVWSVALFYAFTVLASLIVRTILRPSRQFWYRKDRPTPPAVLHDPQLGTHKFMQLKNIKLHYVENGDSSKPLMLFVHGFPELWYSWRHQIKEFSSDYWTIALDMRGYGESEKPDGVQNYKMKYLLDDIKELVTALGRDKFTLVAHDWGGVVAWQFVFHFPEMVEKYIIMDAPHPRGFRRQMFSSLTQFLMSWYIFFFQVPYIPEIMMRSYDCHSLKKNFRKYRTETETKVTDEDIEAFKYFFTQPGAFNGPINYYRANFGSLHKLNSNDGVDLPPGMLIAGEKDDFISQEVLGKAKILVPTCKVEIIKGANHFVQQDDPEAVNKVMRDFLKN